MRSELFTFEHEDGGIQRVQRVSLDSWTALDFLKPIPSPQAFTKLCDLYGNYIVRRYSKLFGRVILFRLPEDVAVNCPMEDRQYGTVTDRLGCAAILFKRGIRNKKGKTVFLSEAAENLYNTLRDRGDLFTAKGERDSVMILPVDDTSGFLTESFKEAKLKANASFFVMDPTDCSTVYDAVGTPFGLCVKDEKVMSPPMFGREALLVDGKGRVSIRRVSLEEILVEIGGKEYIHGENAILCDRPRMRRSPKGGTDIVVRGNRIIAWRDGGNCQIPSGGFIVHLDQRIKHGEIGDVSFGDMDGVSFGIQVGNSVIVDGKKTEGFISPFFSISKVWKPMFPPTLYRLNGKKYRAPRMVLGADEKEQPVLIWLEGAGKFGYKEGEDSTGATLEETADICEKLGIKNAIHLDGGGSAQILIDGQRELCLSDRDPESFAEQERAVARGLFVL